MSKRRCEEWTLPRKTRSLWGLNHRCRNPARFRVQSRDPDKAYIGGEYLCGLHIRPALMDNGDSAWKPWLVYRLTEAEMEAPETP